MTTMHTHEQPLAGGIPEKRPSIASTVRQSNGNENGTAHGMNGINGVHGANGYANGYANKPSAPPGNLVLSSASTPVASNAGNGVPNPPSGSTQRPPHPNNANSNANNDFMDDTGAVSFCGCGRRPRDRKYRRRPGPASWITQRIRQRRASQASNGSIASASIRTADFQDANQSQVGSSVWPPINDTDSMIFFDAEQEALGDDEYPITFLTDEPAQHYITFQLQPLVATSNDLVKESKRDATVATKEDSGSSLDRSRSERLQRIVRRPTLEHVAALQTPPVTVPIKGFPGSLTPHELELCQKFIREVRLRVPEVAEQVYSMRDIEDEPYTICRWMRATKFDVDAILQRLEDNAEAWTRAKDRNFYPDPNEALGAPFSVFLTQYPFLNIGRAKNGCPVNYFQCGKIRPEGILCLTTLKHMEGYFWHQFVYKFKIALQNARQANPNFVRCEGVNILDLSHLSTSALTSDTMDVIKIAGKISDFYPETLHCMLILNAPSFFAMSWTVIKKFIDPRTAARIQVFSNAKRGMARMRELIDDSQIPANYGGGGPSVESVLLREASKSSSLGTALLKQEYDLMHIRRKGGKAHHTFQLNPNETLEIRVYTRSVSSAKFVVNLSKGGEQTVLKQVLVRGLLSTNPDSQTNSPNEGTESNDSYVSLDPMAYPTEKLISHNIKGPGTIIIDAIDQDDVNHAKWHGQSRGYFLIVGNYSR